MHRHCEEITTAKLINMIIIFFFLFWWWEHLESIFSQISSGGCSDMLFIRFPEPTHLSLVGFCSPGQLSVTSSPPRTWYLPLCSWVSVFADDDSSSSWDWKSNPGLCAWGGLATQVRAHSLCSSASVIVCFASISFFLKVKYYFPVWIHSTLNTCICQCILGTIKKNSNIFLR